MVKRPMEPSARSARDLSRFLRDFIGLDDPDNRGTGDMVQQSAAECNEKVKGDRQDNFAAQSGGMMGTSEMTVAPVRKTKNGKKVGRPEKLVSAEQKKLATRAAYLGMPEERIAILCGFASGNPTGWGQYLLRNPVFKQELEQARATGEVEMQGRVLDASNGWQGAAWLLERTRGYVARASLEHTGKGGKDLSISGALLGAFGNTK
jgi:hypothetical protein